MTAYCAAVDVGRYLQRDLEPEEAVQVPGLAAAASDWIDTYTGRHYGPEVVLNETQRIYGPIVYLRRKPVASIEAVRMRLPFAGAATWALTNLAGYELLDPVAGRLTVGWQLRFPSDIQDTSWYNYLLEVDYTVTAAVPARVTQAAALLVASWLLTPPDDGYQSVSIAQVVTLTRKAAATEAIPAAVYALLPKKVIWA